MPALALRVVVILLPPPPLNAEAIPPALLQDVREIAAKPAPILITIAMDQGVVRVIQHPARHLPQLAQAGPDAAEAAVFQHLKPAMGRMMIVMVQ